MLWGRAVGNLAVRPWNQHVSVAQMIIIPQSGFKISGRSMFSNNQRLPKGYSNGKKENKEFGFGALLFLVVPVSTFCLGIWQYNRRNWKLNVIQELETKVRLAEPVDLISIQESIDDKEYCRVRAFGSFDYSKEIYIGPRSLLDATGGTSGGLITTGGDKVGWHVISPFTMEDGTKILVNRGWLPRSKLDPNTRLQSQIQGPMEIVGIVRHTEETSSFVPPNKTATSTWTSRDISALAEKLGTSPIFIDIDSDTAMPSTVLGGPVGGQTRITLRNDHVQYMMTWFGVSLGTLYLWLKRFVW